jgi:DNA-binding transcriptional LysR family regulator
MTTNQLKYFITAAETLSFTEAGKLHYISQTAITQHIQSLEDQLGVKLFTRNKKRVYLTPAGEIFYMEAKALLERSKLAVNKARNAADGVSGSLNIGYVKGQAFSLTGPLIKEFYLHNPSVKFQLFRQAHLDLLMNLEKGKLDFIFNIVYGNTDLTDFSYRRISSDRLYAVLPSGHPYAQLSSIRRYDLREEPFLLTKYYEDPSAKKYGHIIPDKYAESGFIPKINGRSTDAETLMVLVSAGIGITILPESIVRAFSNTSDLSFVPLEGEHEHVDIMAIWKDNSMNPVTNVFKNYVLSQYNIAE